MSKPKKPPLCVQAGHIWVTTTSSRVRRCARCPLIQYYLHGEWHITLQSTQEKEERSTRTDQLPLF